MSGTRLTSPYGAPMTLTVVVLWALLYALLVRPSIQETQRLAQLYQQQIMPLEWPYYQTYLAAHGQLQAADAIKNGVTRQRWPELVGQMQADQGFVADLRDQGRAFMDSTTWERWNRLRTQHDQDYLHLILFRWGIAQGPAGLYRPMTFLTALTLQASLPLLLLSAFSMLLLGFPLELRFGSSSILGLGVIAGVLGGLAMDLVHFKQAGLLLGASGALSALWGVALREHGPLSYRPGPRPLTLPRLPVLAGALLSLLGLLYLNDQWPAAALGLCIGLIAQARLQPTASKTLAAEPEPKAEDPVDALLTRAYACIINLQLAAAHAMLQAAREQHPDDGRLLFALHPLQNLFAPEAALALRQRMLRLAHHDEELAWRLLLAHRQAATPAQDPLAGVDPVASIRMLIRLGELKEAESMTRKALTQKQSSALWGKALLELSVAYRQQEQGFLSEHYERLAREHEAASQGHR